MGDSSLPGRSSKSKWDTTISQDHDVGGVAVSSKNVSRGSDEDTLQLDTEVLARLQYSIVGKFSKLTPQAKALFGLSRSEVETIESIIDGLAAEISDPAKMQIVEMYQGDDSSAFLVEAFPDNEVMQIRSDVQAQFIETLGEARGAAFFDRFTIETEQLPLIRSGAAFI